jgi:pimeloyl-ACP methyl ester carboxylesterase
VPSIFPELRHGHEVRSINRSVGSSDRKCGSYMTSNETIAGLTRGTAAGIELLRRPGKGSARAMVLLHGIGSNAASWIPLMQRLDHGIDVVAWNAPGYGGSTALISSTPIPGDYASALLRLLDTLDIPAPILVGHSLGALFAGSFAASFPHRLSALALVSPAIGYGVAPGAPLPPQVQDRIDDLDRLGAADFAAKRAARLVSDPQARPHVVAEVSRAMAAVRRDGYAQAVRALGAGDLVADARTIAAPAIVAVGRQDVITPPANARTVRDALRHVVSYDEIDDAGHALPQERPEMLAPILMNLAKEHAVAR